MRRRDEVVVGVFITVALIIGIAGTLWLARRGFGKDYPLYSRFAWGAGLKTGQQVLLAGVQVGYVDKVRLRPDGYLDVTMKISKDYQVPRGTTATVVPVGFFGDQSVKLTPPLHGDFTRSLAAGDTVPVGPAGVTMEALFARLDTITLAVDTLTQTVSAEFVRGGGIRDVRRTIGSTNRLIEQLTGIATEQSRQLSLTLAGLRRATSAVDSTQVDSIVRSFAVTSGNLAQLTRNLQETTTRLNSALAKFENGDGSVGRLLNDPGLYNDVRTLVMRLDSLTADFKKNPRRYVNLSIF
jgi:phospholipid/cholesterol/gamma-HCH transport system substrate-binding protein